MDAEILEIQTPGETINILVLFREGSLERRELLSLPGDFTSDQVLQRITETGRRLMAIVSTEAVVRALTGQRIPIEKLPPQGPPPVNPHLGAR